MVLPDLINYISKLHQIMRFALNAKLLYENSKFYGKSSFPWDVRGALAVQCTFYRQSTSNFSLRKEICVAFIIYWNCLSDFYDLL